MTATITDLIYFVTISDILDPILREGLPHLSRQLQGSSRYWTPMECIRCRSSTTTSSRTLLREGAQAVGEALHGWASSASGSRGISCARTRRTRSTRCASSPCRASASASAAGTLTEVFADNEQLLDGCAYQNVAMFINLIRQNGRQGRFVKFLNVLCQCNGRRCAPTSGGCATCSSKRLRAADPPASRPATANNKAAVSVTPYPRSARPDPGRRSSRSTRSPRRAPPSTSSCASSYWRASSASAT